MKKKIDPILKLRYAKGLGDVVKCFLHSRYFGPVTKFLTKKDHTCTNCSIRATAMNILFPIPVWKLFFKNEEKMNQIFEKDLLDYGYKIIDEQEFKDNQNNGNCCEEKENKPCCGDKNFEPENVKFDGYFLVQRVEEEESDFKIVTLKFKKI